LTKRSSVFRFPAAKWAVRRNGGDCDARDAHTAEKVVLGHLFDEPRQARRDVGTAPARAGIDPLPRRRDGEKDPSRHGRKGRKAPIIGACGA
jgi:ferric-dicitrate binding protein FerR (iron transport regulator)